MPRWHGAGSAPRPACRRRTVALPRRRGSREIAWVSPPDAFPEAPKIDATTGARSLEVSMHASAPSSLDSAALARRLGELAGHEREVQVEFLLHLAEFDTRRAWAEAGYTSLWDYLLRVVH